MNTRIYLSLVAFAALLSFTSCGNKSPDSTEAENDKKLDTLDLKADGEFAVAAADGGLLEVTLGKLAQTKSVTPAIQELGKTMELDHSKANEELKAYADMMVDDHQKDIDTFRKESEKGNDGDLKAWATAKLPILAHHLEMAKLARESIKEEKKAN
jgi:putative membrane protein